MQLHKGVLIYEFLIVICLKRLHALLSNVFRFLILNQKTFEVDVGCATLLLLKFIHFSKCKFYQRS